MIEGEQAFVEYHEFRDCRRTFARPKALAFSMIVMVENGGLGNQIFQYLAIKHASKPGERILLFGFDQLKEHFCFEKNVRFVHIQSSFLRHLRSLNYGKISAITQHLPWLSVAGEDSLAMLPARPDSGIKLIYPSWFQNSIYFETDSAAGLNLEPVVRSESESVLGKLNADPVRSLALHIRAGDYRTWPSAEFPAIVQPEWFQDQVTLIREQHPEIRVLAIGDDHEYIDEVIKEIPNSFNVSKEFGGNSHVDFGLLASCRYSVISASSFALWARYLAHQNDGGSVTIAPAFWIGHSQRTWYPENLRPNFIQFAETY